MKRLGELRSLITLARKFGQEPDRALTEELESLERDEAARLVREADMRTRIAADLTAMFEGVTHDPEKPVSVRDVPGLGEAITSAMEAGVIEVSGAAAEPAAPAVSPATQQPSNVDKVAKVIAEAGVVAPDPVLARPTKNLEQEVRRLEQWISRIAATGAGSGEVNFRYLDDVNRSTINDNWVLEYDAATKKFQFTKNVGPIETLQFDTSGSTQAVAPGQVHWNPAEDCLDVHQADGSTLQVGLEQYLQVHNHTTSTLRNGTVVRFGGVAEDAETPVAVPHIADGSIPPLYTIGVLTNDIATSSNGRATIVGKVKDLNTTGSDVGETWQVGDLLWLSPDNAGKMTRVKPTAPDIVVSVAAVLKVSNTSGIILVRPTLWPRLYYGRFENFGNISTTSVNTSTTIEFTRTVTANGFNLGSSNASRIYAVESGFYDFDFNAQILSTNSSAKNFWIWARHNGTTSTTARRKGIVGNGVYDVVGCNFAISMLAGEYVEVMYAVDDAAVIIESAAATAFAPAAPSVTLTVTQIAL